MCLYKLVCTWLQTLLHVNHLLKPRIIMSNALQKYSYILRFFIISPWQPHIPLYLKWNMAKASIKGITFTLYFVCLISHKQLSNCWQFDNCWQLTIRFCKSKFAKFWCKFASTNFVQFCRLYKIYKISCRFHFKV